LLVIVREGGRSSIPDIRHHGYSFCQRLLDARFRGHDGEADVKTPAC
jgi:hypothetical protein